MWRSLIEELQERRNGRRQESKIRRSTYLNVRESRAVGTIARATSLNVGVEVGHTDLMLADQSLFLQAEAGGFG